MRTLTLRRAAAAAVLPLALGSLAACGTNDSSATADDPAAASAPQAGSSVTSADFLALMKAASAKLTTDRFSMDVDVAGQPLTMDGEMDLTGAKPAVHMTMDMSSAGIGNVDMRMVDGVVYMKMGELTHGKYVKFDLSDPNSQLGSLSSTLDNLDPSRLVGKLKADAFRRVTFVGTDSIGRHYKATLVSDKTAVLKGLPSTVTRNLPKTSGYDVWLDGQGRLAKFVVVVPGTTKLTATYRDYGVDLDITAPDPSQVTDMSLSGLG